MRTLAIFYPGCIEFEILLACELLSKHFPIDVVTPDGKDHVGSNGLTIKSNSTFQEVDPSKYRIFLIPGGDPSEVIGNEILNSLLNKAHAQKSILAAICAGPVILEQARLLDGRSIAHGYAGPQKEWLLNNGFFKKTTLTFEPIIVDENIITARPDHFIDFAVATAISAGCITHEHGDSIRNYYGGIIP